MHYNQQPTAAAHYTNAPLSHADYLRIMQNAKTAALAARRAAAHDFWTRIARAVRGMGHHASVRLGAGQRTASTGA